MFLSMLVKAELLHDIILIPDKYGSRMVNANFLKKIMVVGERNQLQNLTQYVNLAEKSSKTLIEMLSIEGGKKVQLNAIIRDIEKKGDDITISMKDQITGGAISSNLMDNLITLVETCDDLLDKSYFVSREIKRVHENTHRFDDWTRDFLRRGYDVCIRILQNNLEALDQVRHLLEAKDFQEMGEARNLIQKLEEKVDDLKDNLIDEIYNSADSLPYIIFVHLTELVHKLDDMLDDCEDIGDLVHTISVSITR